MGDLLFSAGRESVVAIVSSWRVTCVGGPGEILRDVHPQEFSAADSPQSSCRWSMTEFSFLDELTL